VTHHNSDTVHVFRFIFREVSPSSAQQTNVRPITTLTGALCDRQHTGNKNVPSLFWESIKTSTGTRHLANLGEGEPRDRKVRWQLAGSAHFTRPSSTANWRASSTCIRLDLSSTWRMRPTQLPAPTDQPTHLVCAIASTNGRRIFPTKFSLLCTLRSRVS